MGTPVEKFIRDAHKRYNVKYALTAEGIRRLRTKLRLADIVTEVQDHDVPVALDIILADYGMQFVRLADADEARYCSNCHVCVPV